MPRGFKVVARIGQLGIGTSLSRRWWLFNPLRGRVRNQANENEIRSWYLAARLKGRSSICL
jgi:hypothetical protein